MGKIKYRGRDLKPGETVGQADKRIRQEEIKESPEYQTAQADFALLRRAQFMAERAKLWSEYSRNPGQKVVDGEFSTRLSPKNFNFVAAQRLGFFKPGNESLSTVLGGGKSSAKKSVGLDSPPMRAPESIRPLGVSDYLFDQVDNNFWKRKSQGEIK